MDNRKLLIKLYTISAGIYMVLSVIWVTLSYMALTRFGDVGVLYTMLMAIVVWLLFCFLFLIMVNIYERASIVKKKSKTITKEEMEPFKCIILRSHNYNKDGICKRCGKKEM